MIRYALESRADVLEEIQPLLARHWEEVAFYRDVPLAPDWLRYELFDRQKRLRVFTARLEAELIGYCVATFGESLHYRGSVTVEEDLVFLAPEHRKGRLGVGLISFADLHLQGELRDLYPGQPIVMKRHVKLRPDLDYGPLLEHLGYQPMERIFVKRLD